MDIIERLDDLIKQATTERSHYYTADTAKLARAEIERLRAVRDIADLLVNECEGGLRSPSLGLLARLESALVTEHKARRSGQSTALGQ
jgi:hypothetical protein